MYVIYFVQLFMFHVALKKIQALNTQRWLELSYLPYHGMICRRSQLAEILQNKYQTWYDEISVFEAHSVTAGERVSSQKGDSSAAELS